MACKTSCKMCEHLVVSTAVTYTAGTGVTITIPTATYRNGEKVCIVIAQPFPAAATIASPVFITIGTTNYPLVRCDCTPANVCSLRTRTRYSTRVVTNATGGSFKLMGKVCDCPTEQLATIGG